MIYFQLKSYPGGLIENYLRARCLNLSVFREETAQDKIEEFRGLCRKASLFYYNN